MKIIFLDFDGVLNRFSPYSKDQDCDLEKEAIGLLNELLMTTGANVVISSSWRMYIPMSKILELMRSVGFKYSERIIGFTPILINRQRGDEIRLWLHQVSGVESFVILDDTDNMGNLFPRFVKTNSDFGLERRHIEKAKELLAMTVDNV